MSLRKIMLSGTVLLIAGFSSSIALKTPAEPAEQVGIGTPQVVTPVTPHEHEKHTSLQKVSQNINDFGKDVSLALSRPLWGIIHHKTPKVVVTEETGEIEESGSDFAEPQITANWSDIGYSLRLPKGMTSFVSPRVASPRKSIGTHTSEILSSSASDASITDENQGASYDVGHVINVGNGSSVSPKVINCMAQVIAGEARGENTTGQVGVANVVNNRTNEWGGSHCQHIYAKNENGCEFYATCRGIKHYAKDVMDRAKTIALAQLQGKLKDVTGGATYFKTCNNRSKWAFDKTVQIQNHCYYKDDGALTSDKAPRIRYELVRDESLPYNYSLVEEHF